MENGRSVDRMIGLLGMIPRVAAMSIMGPTLLLVFGYIGWVSWGAQHLDQSYYSLKVDDLQVPPQPSWIKTSVVEEVYHGSVLKNVSLLDNQSSATIAQAFKVHPWVRKRPDVTLIAGGKVRVNIEYRRPVAMVYLNPYSPLIKKVSSDGSESPPNRAELNFLAVDADAVLLPSGENQPYNVYDYIQICAQDGASPSGPAGEPFGDQRIVEGVRLATILAPVKDELGIFAIYVYRDQLSNDHSRFLLEITTRSSVSSGRQEKRLFWGHAPDYETAGELPIEAKIKRLAEAVRNPAPSTDFINISGISPAP